MRGHRCSTRSGRKGWRSRSCAHVACQKPTMCEITHCDAPYFAADAMSRKRGAFALLPSIPWPGVPKAIALGSGLIGGMGPIVNIAARAAAANPRRPTPAMPAAPPDFVSGSRAIGGEANGGVPTGGVAGEGGGGIIGGRWLSVDGLLI